MTRGIHALLLLLACVPALSSPPRVNGRNSRCFHDGRWMDPGQTVVTKDNPCYEEHTTCDNIDRVLRTSIQTGCPDEVKNDKCYQDKETAVFTLPGQSPMQCTCNKLPDGYFRFQCNYGPCKDVRTGEEKRKGEQVVLTHPRKNVTYLCTCIGNGHGENCIEEQNIGKCKDWITYLYVPSGSAVRKKTYDGWGILLCTCAGTDVYENCAYEAHVNAGKCKAFNGDYVAPGEKLHILKGGILFECVCGAGLRKENCVEVNFAESRIKS